MCRQRVKIDWDAFDKFCLLQCTLKEIAGFFDCSEDTIERAVKRDKKLSFAEYHEKKSAGGKMSLRRLQYKAAEAGNVTMQIWLGKQYLGQSDKQSIEASGADGGPLKIMVEYVTREAI